MKKLPIVGLIGIVFLAFIGNILFIVVWTQTHVLPNHYVGHLNISNLDTNSIPTLLNHQLQSPLEVSGERVSSHMTLQQLGFQISTQSIASILVNENHLPWTMRTIMYLRSLFKPTVIDPHISAGEDASYKLASVTQNNQLISASDLTQVEHFVNEPINDQRVVDQKHLENMVNALFGEKVDTLSLPLVPLPTDEIEKIKMYQQNFSHVFDHPVNVVLPTTNRAKNVVLKPDDLKSLVKGQISPDNLDLQFSIDPSAFQKLMESRDPQVLDLEAQQKMNYSLLVQGVVGVLHSRLYGVDTDSVLSQIEYHPTTHGEIANKYIEVDIGQQLMYLWQNGKNIATYTVSTGIAFPTPTGRFKIVNKARNPFSNISHVYMPYWMAIYFEPTLKAWIGIHELPYKVTDTGISRRPEEYLGSPNTGGCISLDVGIAQKVQQWADIGMPVVIYK